MSLDIQLVSYLCYCVAGSIVVITIIANLIMAMPKKDQSKVDRSASGDAVAKLSVGEVMHFSPNKNLKDATPTADRLIPNDSLIHRVFSEKSTFVVDQSPMA